MSSTSLSPCYAGDSDLEEATVMSCVLVSALCPGPYTVAVPRAGRGSPSRVCALGPKWGVKSFYKSTRAQQNDGPAYEKTKFQDQSVQDSI